MTIAEALFDVRARIDRAAHAAGRDSGEVRLIAVSKTFPAEAVLEALTAGQRDFGENRVEEALPKIAAVAAASSDAPRWHLIGHLQSRKVRDAGRSFGLIHSVDSLRLATRIDAQSAAPQEILLECNVSGEESKAGFVVAGWESDAAHLDAFLAEVRQIIALPNLRVRGLMTMAPIVDQPDAARPFFASLRRLRDALRERFPDDARTSWRELSMGMSDDFEAAVAEGATLVRIGRAIFGSR
jgi:hypothetical protein